MIEERLINIETKIAYQEDLIEELNKTIYQQQQKLERLSKAALIFGQIAFDFRTGIKA